MRNLVVIAATSLLLASGVAASQGGTCQSDSKTTNTPRVQRDQQGRLQVGEYVDTAIESPHPYAGIPSAKPQLIFTREIHHPGATFIVPHFSRMELTAGDYVIVRSPDYSRSWRYEGYGKKKYGKDGGGGFWGSRIAGERAIVELWAKGPASAFGFSIDRYSRGFTAAEMGQEESDTEAVCTADDKENAVCYESSEPAIYNEAKAVVRLLISGSSLCTGWLLGDEGHMVTNEHCITTQADADNTDYEFMAEGADCSTSCGQLQCDGTIEATQGVLVQDNTSLDFALVKLPGNLSSTYGFMQLRETGAVLEERIYSPQHPGGRGKEIAVFSTYPDNPSGFGEVDSLTESGCSGPEDDVGYFLDTEGGSSGSPVLAYSDNLVVALHHCRGNLGCNRGDDFDDPNRGVAVPLIIASLGANLPNNAIGGASEEIFPDGFESGDVSAWSTSKP